MSEDLGIIFVFGFDISTKTNRGTTDTALNYFVQTIKSSAQNEQNVAGINLNKFLMRVLAPTLGRHIGYSAFQDLQQRLLYTFSADVPGNRRIIRAAGDLVNLVNIDDAFFCSFNIKVGILDQAQENILYVFTNITGFCKCGSINNCKGYMQNSGQGLCQQGFSRTCRSQ